MRIIKRLEEETDVNTITEYFSYEHFYVIYCKFWELDKDHDLLIDKADLQAHGDHGKLLLSPLNHILDHVGMQGRSLLLYAMIGMELIPNGFYA